MADLPPPVLTPTEPPPDSLIGKVLNDRFTVLERIGSGGMGRVYRAMQAPLNRACALKVLNPSYSAEQDPAFAKRFFLEASVTSKLTHPNTITIFDYGRTDDGVFFIAMEYLQGRTLHQTIAAEGHLPPSRAIHIARQICRSLREAHGLGIVHRDLKPANVMLLHHGDDEDFVKVLDFGLVKFFTNQPDRSPDEVELTQGGVFLGSPTYMAPEQARNHADPRSDIYSLGVVVYHLLAGRPPFQGKAAVDIILKHVNEPPPPFHPDLRVPPDVEAVVFRALRKTPSERFQTMDEFLDALKRLGMGSSSDVLSLSGLDSRPNRPMMATPSPSAAMARPAGSSSGPISVSSQAILIDEDPVPTEPGSSKRAPVMILGGMALFGVAAGAVVLLSRPSPPKLDAEVVPAAAVQPKPAPVVTAPPTPTPAPKVLHVSSTPSGAAVQLGSQVLGSTPLDFKLDAEKLPSPFHLTVSAPGFEVAEVVPDPSASGWNAEVSLTKVKAPTPTSPPETPHRPSRPQPKKPTGTKPAGYKDDPYGN